MLKANVTTALLVPAAALGALLLAKAMQGGHADPNKPVPNPQAPTNVDVLRQQVNDLLMQATANPLSVDPDAMEQLAVQLDGAGLHEEAQRLRLAEIIARGAQGGHVTPPPPGTFTPAPGTMPTTMPPAMAAKFAALMDPNASPPAWQLDQFASEVAKLGFPTQVAQLHQRAAEMRALHGTPPIAGRTRVHRMPRGG